eukprot:jgi/Mesen1/7701/ME000405S06987
MQEAEKLHCEHCRIVGWGHHPVTAQRYHFVVPANEEELVRAHTSRREDKVCQLCSALLPASSEKCTMCGGDAMESTFLKATTHLLHGVLHTNGFGHLLRINGREQGSRSLTGTDLMNLWDHICTMLRARKVSVVDVSKKRGLDLRLLHTAAHGIPWYGLWGYKFGRGSYAITRETYEKAVAT